MSDYVVVVPAAGKGHRMGSAVPKQYLTIQGKSILIHTLEKLLSYPYFSQVILVLHPEDSYWSSLKFYHPKLQVYKVGGQERIHSVYNGLFVLKPRLQVQDWVLVHDAVRPCLQHVDLDRLILHLSHHPIGGLLGVPVDNTLKQVDAQQCVVTTVTRQLLWQALTPQMFRYGLLCRALQQALAHHKPVTDEASAIEWLGMSPQMVLGRADNIKVTCAEDVERVACYLA